MERHVPFASASLVPTVLIVAPVLAPSSAFASDGITWSSSLVLFRLDAPTDTYYVAHDLCQPDCMFSSWVYREDNGISGLQRKDEAVNNTCHGMIRGDEILF